MLFYPTDDAVSHLAPDAIVFGPMESFEFRCVGDRDSSRRAAVRRALQVANAKGIDVASEPVVRRRRFPIPIFGPRTGFVVRFDEATRRVDTLNRARHKDP